jgi:hypothetical protein
MFEGDLHSEKFQTADLRVFSTLKIPAHTGVPVISGTTMGKSQNQMPSGVMAVSSIASMSVWLFM